MATTILIVVTVGALLVSFSFPPHDHRGNRLR
jgi:hypothetical protein